MSKIPEKNKTMFNHIKMTKYIKIFAMKCMTYKDTLQCKKVFTYIVLF